RLRMVGDPIEIQLGNITRVVTGVGWGIRPARALHQGQAKPEGVHRIRRMHVHVAKQDLFGAVDVETLLSAALPRGPRSNLLLRRSGLTDLAGGEGILLPITLGIREIARTCEVRVCLRGR